MEPGYPVYVNRLPLSSATPGRFGQERPEGRRNSRIRKDFFDSRRGAGYNSPLMSKRQERLPVQVDPFRLAEAGRLLAGDIPLARLKRLRPLLVSDQGTVQVELAFGVDATGVSVMTGHVRVNLELVCQRCLQSLAWQVDTGIALAFIRHEAEEAAIPAPYEPFLVESVPLYLNDMIEDEIILALPQIPRHSLEACSGRKWVEEEHPAAATPAKTESQAPNPFDVLAELKTPNKGK